MRYNPFNPQLPPRPDFFVGREPEITEFERFLGQTIHNSPMNMSVTGNRGMGKTSLLVKFEQLAKTQKCLTIRLSNYEGNVKSIPDLAEFLASNIRNELLSKRPGEQLLEWLKTWRPTLEWKDINVSLTKQVVQELFRERLLKLWDAIQPDYAAAVILIDEAESLERIEGALPFLREVFQRVGTDANYMVILAGKLNFPERMSESFSPLNRFFPVRRLTPLGRDEIKHYLKGRLQSVRVSITEDSFEYIMNQSEGHPYVLVAMAFILFDSLAKEENNITLELVKRAEPKMLAQLQNDFFSPMYHPLSNRAKEILRIIAANVTQKEFTFREVISWVDKEGPNVSPYILELLNKGIINKPERAHYAFFHGLFLNYVRSLSH